MRSPTHNKRMQRNAKSVTIFAIAKTAPLFAPADARRYILKALTRYPILNHKVWHSIKFTNIVSD